LLSLRFGEVKESEFRVTEKKTKKERVIELDHAIRVYLARYAILNNLRDNDYLFPGKTRSKPLSRSQAYRVFSTVGKELFPGTKIGTHTMRKTFAMNLFFSSKGDINAVKEALNHKYIDTTMRYLVDSEGFFEYLRVFLTQQT